MELATLELVLILTDKIFSIARHIEEVKTMDEEEVKREIARERAIKDNLVEEVTLP